ncbi:tRNA (guanine-N7-)-methyltransferase [Acetitomaculum ruminis DSM 5522]|uniref:tRNA (guanine-N(7)-)-methyltransferase n=1 Tax=Acetitomaculum ruminis DSM 5522 TaxID=1120918 RepID=A0A1I0W9A7_9FIRM|nr:tRNA (guanosine(46)-N7)-methyltransferase TrmB [Acetitomaculum ruminis]SFA84830.1 tRNA (guanine-N7-)-methyltransferase [Acetitomaculum ruminis DSM 5522]
MRLRNIPGSEEKLFLDERVINEPDKLKGKWKEFFGNDNELFVEIGMGKGKFIIENAIKYPKINFIGVEKYSSVLIRALEKLDKVENPPSNIRFMRFEAENIRDIFENGEIEKIYLNFSDPWPKDRHAKRRLTARGFLEKYYDVLDGNGKIEFKTDNTSLYEFSLEEAKESSFDIEAFTTDLHNDETLNRDNIMTEYEKKFSEKGNNIYKIILKK